MAMAKDLGFILQSRLKSSQKVFGSSPDICVPIAPMCVPWDASHYYRLQGLWLGESDDYFSPLKAWLIPFSIVKD